MLDRKVFDDGIEEILVAFNGLEMNEAKADVWYNHSKQVSNEAWNKKVSICIKRCFKSAPVLADILDEKGNYDNGFTPIQPRKI